MRLQRPELAKLLPSERPDKKPLSEPLPLWVDCHLSWMADDPKFNRSLRFPKGVALRSTRRKCKGQIEEWAH